MLFVTKGGFGFSVTENHLLCCTVDGEKDCEVNTGEFCGHQG
jgi:hypothetical protein